LQKCGEKTEIWPYVRNIAGRPAGARKMSITDYVSNEAGKDVPKLNFEVRRSVFSCSDGVEVLHGEG